MRWLDAVAPVRMRRVAVVAPADALRDVLVCVANAAAVEIDDGNRGQAAPGQAARRLQHAGQALPEPALSAVSPDLDGLERTARYDLLAGEAQLEGYAAGAVSRSGAAALAGWMPAERLPALAAALAEAGGALVPLRHPRGIDAPTLLGDQAGQAPLRPLVQTYGTVPYADIDPTWLAWAAYVLMFGMMFGDAGQGLLLVAAAGALHSGWPRAAWHRQQDCRLGGPRTAWPPLLRGGGRLHLAGRADGRQRLPTREPATIPGRAGQEGLLRRSAISVPDACCDAQQQVRAPAAPARGGGGRHDHLGAARSPMWRTAGPLLVVRGVQGVGWNSSPTPVSTRRCPGAGWCLRQTRILAVVQVLEGTRGSPRRPRGSRSAAARYRSRWARARWAGV